MAASFGNVQFLQCLTSHTNDVTSCDFAPNFVLVTCSSDKTIRIWDWIPESGYQERSYSPLRGHRFAVTCVKVSPQGCILASSSVDGTTVLWNMHSGAKIHVLVQINGDAVRVCRFSNDSALLVTASDNGAICIWDLIHRSLIRSVFDHEGAVQSLAFTPDSQYLVSTCSLEKIKVWHTQRLVDTTEDVCTPLSCADNAHDLGILSIDISNVIIVDDENPLVKYYTLATSGNNKKIKIWRIRSHTLPKYENSLIFVVMENINMYIGHESAVNCVKFSNNGNFLISCSMDKTIKIWNNSGACINTLKQHSRYVNTVALSKDCSLLVSGSNDKSVIVWDVNGNLSLESELIKPSLLLAGAFINQHINEYQVAQNNEDGFRLVEKLDDIAEASVNSCHFSVDNILATGSSDKLIKLFKIDENINIEELNISQLNEHTYTVNHVEFSKSGKMLATCSLDGCAIIWDPLSGEKIAEMPQNDMAIKDCRFSTDERFLITVGDDEKASIWDVNSAQLIMAIEAHSDSVTSACFTPDDNLIATVCASGEFRLWTIDAKNIHVEYHAHDLGIQFSDFSENLEPIPLLTSNGRRNYLLGTCGNDSLVKLWAITYAKKTEHIKVKNWRTFVGHGGNVTCVRFSPKLAELVCSTATDRQLRVWSVYSGECLQVLNHDSIVTSCCFNSSCSLLATGCLDRSLWLWRLPENLKMELSFTKRIKSRKRNLDDWGSEDVVDWLKTIGLTEISTKIQDFELDGQKILTTAEEVICTRVGLNEEEAHKLIQELKWLKKDEQSPGISDHDLLSVPDEFLCPITHELMREPVRCADGFTYEKQAITEWFMSGKFTSPMTNEILANADFVINQELRNDIHKFLYKENAI